MKQALGMFSVIQRVCRKNYLHMGSVVMHIWTTQHYDNDFNTFHFPFLLFLWECLFIDLVVSDFQKSQLN